MGVGAADVVRRLAASVGELDALKAKRKETPHHVTVRELPEEARFRQLSTQSKHLIDTIKMIA